MSLQSNIIQIRNLQIKTREILISKVKIEAEKLILLKDEIKGFSYNQGHWYFTDKNNRIIDCQTETQFHNIF